MTRIRWPTCPESLSHVLPLASSGIWGHLETPTDIRNNSAFVKFPFNTNHDGSFRGGIAAYSLISTLSYRFSAVGILSTAEISSTFPSDPWDSASSKTLVLRE